VTGHRPPCRLHVLAATAAPLACVLRRGPTDWFHVARWRYLDGVVEHGAWTRVKIYPERCGLSPDGSLLGVFALGGEWGPYFAVSRVPWLHALAAWAAAGTWTTGVCFGADGTLELAGCVGPEPRSGTYPGPVARRPVDTHWVRARLQRELSTGWEVVEAPWPPWVHRLPAPLQAHPAAVVARRAPAGRKGEALVVVSLREGHREYYLVGPGAARPLEGIRWAETAREGRLLAATDAGELRVLASDLSPEWTYDMNPPEPDPRPAPEWARRW
jgi:hypothetical protein